MLLAGQLSYGAFKAQSVLKDFLKLVKGLPKSVTCILHLQQT